MIDKLVASPQAAVADIPDGATIMLSGFGNAGMPVALIDALIAQGARELTIINNNAGNGDTGPAAPMKGKAVRQGTLAERIRAAGAGIGAFYPPTAYGTKLAEGKETRRIGDRDHVLEHPIHADYALVKADRADRWGNLVYRKPARNFGPIMAAAAKGP